MPVSLHKATIASFLQTLPQVVRLVDAADAHCRQTGAPDLCGARLADDMWPFAKQVTSVIAHSAGAVRALDRGVFSPDLEPAPHSFDELRGRLAEAIAFLEAIDPQDFEKHVGRDMRFEFGDSVMEFWAEDFLLSFTMPNFYFHTTSAYAILRNQGLAVGKRDYIGRPRLKG